MIEYIYFVKCPGCEDEHFDFFEEAKEFALGCLSQKPIITQIEVDRNDFGECRNSADLGTVWSWEDLMDNRTDDEPAISIFTKDDLATLRDADPEFDALDNSLDCVPDNFKKPIPEGMTLKELVEEMEANEDTVECVCCQELYPKEECKHDEKHGWICPDCADEVVECTWCEELFDRSECRYEVDMGWLCDRCEAAIKSRGETLTFREGSYWDFLDESTAVQDSTMIGKYVQLVHRNSKYQTVGSPLSMVDLKSLLKSCKRRKLDDNGINLIAKFDNKCKVIQETDKGYLVKIPYYYRDGQDHSKFEERPRYIECWVPKANAKIIEGDLSEAITTELHDLGNEYDGGYPADSELEDTDTYLARLVLCPECGKTALDPELSMCSNCGATFFDEEPNEISDEAATLNIVSLDN